MGEELVEAFGAPEIFVSGLAAIEDVGGGCLRFVFYTRTGQNGREATVKLIAPIEAVPPAVMMAAKAVGWCLAKDRVCNALVN
jgi:hypothetical protein